MQVYRAPKLVYNHASPCCSNSASSAVLVTPSTYIAHSLALRADKHVARYIKITHLDKLRDDATEHDVLISLEHCAWQCSAVHPLL